MYSPRNRTSWDLYMLKDRSKDKFYGRSHLVRLRGKYTVQTAHCAMLWTNPDIWAHLNQFDSFGSLCRFGFGFETI